MLDDHPINAQSLEKHYGIKGKTLQRQYKESLSDFKSWTQKEHAKNYLLFPDNIGPFLSIDETALSKGELYTILTNKCKRGKKGSIVAMAKGTKAEVIIDIINHIPKVKRDLVQEVTLDMAASMNMIIKRCFTKATRVTDRFHVQKLAFEAVQEIRIKHRWEALEEENQNKEPVTFENGDSPKQLLARCRYLLFKSSSKWTPSQIIRSKLLFKEYPSINAAYKLSMQLSSIYEHTKEKGIALTKMARWFNQVEKSQFSSFKTIKKTFYNHYQSILNYFDSRSTNAAAESFNAKIKDFRRSFRGVRDISFFLFRITKIFA